MIGSAARDSAARNIARRQSLKQETAAATVNPDQDSTSLSHRRRIRGRQ